MLELAAEEVGDGREADMGMRADVDALAGDELGRPHLVEEDERPDHLALRRGKRATNLEIADVARPRHDQGLDRLDGDGVGTDGIQRRVPAHIGLHLSEPSGSREGRMKRSVAAS